MNKFASKDFIVWVVFVLASILIATVVLIKFVDLSDPVTGSFILFIMVLFSAGLFYSFKQQALLVTEKYGLDQDNTTIASQITASIQELSREHHLTTPNDYLTTYHNQTGKYIGAIGSVASILITLGILGTIFGLTVSLSGLKGLVSSAGNSNAIVTEMSNILAGVDLAFFTTLFGAFFGGIILRLNLILHDHIRDDVVSTMGRRWIEICSKNSDRSKTGMAEDLLMRETEKFLGSLSDQSKKILEAMGDQAKQFLSTLGEYTEPLRSSVALLDGELKDTATNIKGLGNSISEAANDVNKFGSEMGTISTQPLQQSLDALNGDIDTTSDHYKKLSKTLGEETPAVASSLSGLTQDIVKAAVGYKKLHDAFTQLTGPLKKSLDDLTVDINKTATGYNDLHKTIDDLTMPLKNNLSGLNEVISDTTEKYQSLHHMLGEVTSPLGRRLTDLEEDMTATSTRYKELNKVLGELAHPLSKNLSDLSQHMLKTSGSVKELLAAMKDLAALPVHNRLSMLVEKMDNNNEVIKNVLLEQMKAN